MSLAILVPVLGRPHRVAPLLESITAATPFARVLFITDPDDVDEQDAIDQEDGEQIAVEGSYACKINAGVGLTDDLLLFLGADDLEPRAGWFEAAKANLSETIQVVGVNDLIKRRRPQHATHFLMTREYADLPTIDGEPGPLHEGYHHWNVDDELIATAKHRGVYSYAEDSHVRHLHPFAGLADDDSTYEKGRSRMRHDGRLFRRRMPLWT